MALLQDSKVLYEQDTQIKAIFNNGNRIWPTVVPIDPIYFEPFYVENIEDVTETLRIRKTSSSGLDIAIEKSTDKEHWDTFGTTSTTAMTYTLNPGDKLYLRAVTTCWDYNRIDGISKIGGNIMSILYGSEFVGKTEYPNVSGVFARLFRDSSKLVDAGDLLLVAETVGDNCFSTTFKGCPNLSLAPVLPAKTLTGSNTYNNFFADCPKVQLIKCYAEVGISTARMNWWLNSSTGTFYKVAGTVWSRSMHGIPPDWTVYEL